MSEFAVTRNQSQLIASDAQQRDRLGDRHVGLLRRIDSPRIPNTVLIRGQPRLARHGQAHQVGG